MTLHLSQWGIRRGESVRIGPMDFTLQDSEIVTLMGPSGCGKSTLLLALLGYEELGLDLCGDRIQDGRKLAPGTVPARSLYLPQNLPFNPNWEVLGFLCRLPWGKPNLWETLFPVQPKRIRRVREVLHQLGLDKRDRATVAELSGGEAQRAAVAQILLLSPQLLVGDEFVSGLDPGMAAWILDLCRQNLDRSGGSALFALHDVQSALRISDRILVIWPPHIDTQPWEFHRSNWAWEGNVLYTTLCLARYAKDLPPSPSIGFLAQSLQAWLNDEEVLRQYLLNYQDETAIIIDRDGKTQPFDRAELFSPQPPLSSTHWTEMYPIRVTERDRTSIGLAIPKLDRPGFLTIIAQV